MAVKEQFAGTCMVGIESDFLSVLPLLQAWLVRPVSVELDTDKHKTSLPTSVWREQGAPTKGGISYGGTLEFELDTEADGQWAFWRMLLEDRGTTGSGPTRHRFETPQAGLPITGRLLFGFDGGPWVTYFGVLVERIRIQARSRQTVRMIVQWKAADRYEQAGDPGWSAALTPFNSWLVPKDLLLKLDDVAEGQCMEFGFEIIDPKSFGGYGDNGVPTRRARDGTASLTGTLIQYWDASTVDLAAKMRDLDPFKIFFSAVDSSNGYGLELTIPEAYVDTGEPVPLGRQDVMINASFRADLTQTGTKRTFLDLLVSP